MKGSEFFYGILLIRDMGLDVEIVSITTKTYIPQKNLLYEFVANVYIITQDSLLRTWQG